jgi:sarcosine oxidase subunit beta
MTRVVIVGAGMLGLSCAVEVAEDPSHQVTVLDARHPAYGSSGRSVGTYSTMYAGDADTELRVWGVNRLDELERDRGLTVRHIGFLRLGRDPRTEQIYQQVLAMQAKYGREGARLLSLDEIAGLVPHFDATGVVSAVYSPREGYLDGTELCSVLAEQAAERGATIRGRTPLRGVTSGTDSTFLVETDQDTIPADIIVNCAGPWASEVGALLDAPVQVVNERHEAHIFELPPEMAATYPMVLDTIPGYDDTERLYFRHEGEHQLIAGLHSNVPVGSDVCETPDDCHYGSTDEHAQVVIEKMAAAFPDIDGIRYRGGWAGLYPHSPDQRPVAGPHPDNPNILVGGGLGGVGLALAPAVGRALADWIVFGEPRTFACGSELVPRPAVTAAT